MDSIKLIEVMETMELNVLYIAAGTKRKLVELFDSIEWNLQNGWNVSILSWLYAWSKGRKAEHEYTMRKSSIEQHFQTG